MLNDIDGACVIIHPKPIFERHGITKTLVSDNGPPYHEFMHFEEIVRMRGRERERVRERQRETIFCSRYYHHTDTLPTE